VSIGSVIFAVIFDRLSVAITATHNTVKPNNSNIIAQIGQVNHSNNVPLLFSLTVLIESEVIVLFQITNASHLNLIKDFVSTHLLLSSNHFPAVCKKINQNVRAQATYTGTKARLIKSCKLKFFVIHRQTPSFHFQK
jgi:hypothetical protein